MKEFELNRFTVQAEELLAETKRSFEKLELDTVGLPAAMQPDDGPIKLVFVGQYSAGKSSIIKMLSGIETDIGAAITTQKATAYDWNGLEIIDTPGIHTGLREDHDAITYSEIDQAALLVFVVTSEGFDRQIGAHFRKLAIEQKRGSNMVLVVNKMDRAPQGNSPKQQEIIRNDMRKVIEPLTPENVYLSFISTQSYEEYLEETDAEIKAELLEESGHDAFISNLNAFVASRQVSARIERPLYTLESRVRDGIGAPTDEESLQGAEELTKRKLRILDDARNDCMQSIQEIAGDCQSDILSEGRRVTEEIFTTCKSEEAVKAVMEGSAQRVGELLQKCDDKIKKAYAAMAGDVERQMDTELNSQFAKGVAKKWDYAVERSNQNAVVAVTNAGGGAAIGMGDLAKMVKDSTLRNTIGANLTTFSGGMMHEGVKTVGSFLGMKFKPWEALKFAKWLNVAITVISALITLWDMVQADEKRREAQQKEKEAREEIKAQYEQCANDVYSKAMEEARNAMRALIDPEIAKVKEDMNQIRAKREIAIKRGEVLNGILTKIRDLTAAIEAGRA